MRIQYSLVRLNDSRIYNININGHSLHVTVTAQETAFSRWHQSILNDDTNLRNLVSDRFVVGIGVGISLEPNTRDNVGETLTLCIGNRCLIFQLRYCEYVPEELRMLLLDPTCTFVGFWTEAFRSSLYHSPQVVELHMDPLEMLYFFYTDRARGSVERIMRSFLRLREDHLGFMVSDWSVETLGAEQVLRASFQAYCAFTMGINTQAWLYRQPGSLPGPDDAAHNSGPSSLHIISQPGSPTGPASSDVSQYITEILML